jgi:hypothetical protein
MDVSGSIATILTVAEWDKQEDSTKHTACLSHISIRTFTNAHGAVSEKTVTAVITSNATYQNSFSARIVSTVDSSYYCTKESSRTCILDTSELTPTIETRKRQTGRQLNKYGQSVRLGHSVTWWYSQDEYFLPKKCRTNILL